MNKINLALAKFKKYKISYTIKPNNQITVERRGVIVDFWPTSGTWLVRTGGRAVGLDNLLSFLFRPEEFSFTKAASAKKATKADKIQAAKNLLTEKCIPYNALTPYQLRIEYAGGYVDFWPTSEKWSANGTIEKGITKLLAFLSNKVLGF